MTEIKKATIDDVDVSRFKTRLNPRNAASSKAVVFRVGAELYLGPYEGCRVLHRKFNRHGGDQWRADSDAGLCGADWLPHAVAVSEEFESWLVTELARIDREREETARPKIPTVKAPEGYKWEALDDETVGFVDKYGCEWVAQDKYDRADPEHSLMCELSIIKARAEALGKRIVVAEEIERPMPANSLWKEL